MDMAKTVAIAVAVRQQAVQVVKHAEYATAEFGTPTHQVILIEEVDRLETLTRRLRTAIDA